MQSVEVRNAQLRLKKLSCLSAQEKEHISSLITEQPPQICLPVFTYDFMDDERLSNLLKKYVPANRVWRKKKHQFRPIYPYPIIYRKTKYVSPYEDIVNQKKADLQRQIKQKESQLQQEIIKRAQQKAELELMQHKELVLRQQKEMRKLQEERKKQRDQQQDEEERAANISNATSPSNGSSGAAPASSNDIIMPAHFKSPDVPTRSESTQLTSLLSAIFSPFLSPFEKSEPQAQLSDQKVQKSYGLSSALEEEQYEQENRDHVPEHSPIIGLQLSKKSAFKHIQATEVALTPEPNTSRREVERISKPEHELKTLLNFENAIDSMTDATENHFAATTATKAGKDADDEAMIDMRVDDAERDDSTFNDSSSLDDSEIFDLDSYNDDSFIQAESDISFSNEIEEVM